MNKSGSSVPLLSASNIRKVFTRKQGPLTVLENVDFSLDEGEAIAIIGTSGSGKSTLLNILGSLDWPTDGQLHHKGDFLNFRNKAVADRWRSKKVGFVFQNHMLLPDFTALDNLLLPVRRLGDVTSETHQRALGFLKNMGLADRANHLPGEMSGGEQQRIAVARAFMNRPAIVLADEPFGNLDQEIGGHLGEMLFGLRDTEGTSLVIVTHDLHLARRADRILELVEGRLKPVIKDDLV
ncbi:MAG: ABC transporter ATP-binding protein [bacterium]|nr:ABC transporter ATP-binding protein [bacterium]